MIEKKEFKSAAALSDVLADKWFVPISTAVNKYLDYSPLRMAHILAQLGHESDGFLRLEEDLMYHSEERITKIFGTRNGLSLDIASQLVGKPEALANFVYGGVWGAKNLGNILQGDGYRFRGAGLIQVTGRDNFIIISRALKIGLDVLPGLMRSDPDTAATAAIWWICNSKLLNYFDRDDLIGATRLINGALDGLPDRRRRLNQAKNILC